MDFSARVQGSQKAPFESVTAQKKPRQLNDATGINGA